MNESTGTPQSRLKSPVVWAAVVAQILAVLITLGAIDTGLGEVIEGIAAGVLQLLTIFGVLNNPTDKAHF